MDPSNRSNSKSKSTTNLSPEEQKRQEDELVAAQEVPLPKTDDTTTVGNTGNATISISTERIFHRFTMSPVTRIAAHPPPNPHPIGSFTFSSSSSSSSSTSGEGNKTNDPGKNGAGGTTPTPTPTPIPIPTTTIGGGSTKVSDTHVSVNDALQYLDQVSA